MDIGIDTCYAAGTYSRNTLFGNSNVSAAIDRVAALTVRAEFADFDPKVFR
jgi:hypothetical protein